MKENKEITKEPEIITDQVCPICKKKTLTLIQTEHDIPFFGKAYLFSMSCSNCHYHKADVEFEEKHDPVKYELTIDSEEDLKIRVVKSSQATVKLGRIATIEPNEASNGYITNVEGIINRIKKIIEFSKQSAETPEEQKTAKNHLKKLNRVLWGSEKIKLTITDKTGNSAIISEKAIKKKI